MQANLTYIPHKNTWVYQGKNYPAWDTAPLFAVLGITNDTPAFFLTIDDQIDHTDVALFW
jgi:hypothetical protein